MTDYVAKMMIGDGHAWAVRVCGSYFADPHCGDGASDEFVAAYALSTEAWVAFCEPGGVHQEVEHTAGVPFEGAGGCNQYTVPKYAPVRALPPKAVVYVLDEAHSWGEALIPLKDVGVGLESFDNGALGVPSLVLVAMGVSVVYTLWSLLMGTFSGWPFLRTVFGKVGPKGA